MLLGESADTTIQRTQPIGATEGRPVRLSCRSRAGKPVAKLSWALAEDWEAQRLIGHIANATDRTGEGEQQQITTMHPIRGDRKGRVIGKWPRTNEQLAETQF